MSMFKDLFRSFKKSSTKPKETPLPHWQRNLDGKPIIHGLAPEDIKPLDVGGNSVSNIRIESEVVPSNLKPDSGRGNVRVSLEMTSLDTNLTTDKSFDVVGCNTATLALEAIHAMDAREGAKKVEKPDKIESVTLVKTVNLEKVIGVDEKNNNLLLQSAFDGLGSWMDDRCTAPIIPEKNVSKVDGDDVPVQDGRRRYSIDELLDFKRVQDEEFTILGLSGDDDDDYCIQIKLDSPDALVLKPAFDRIKKRNKNKKKTPVAVVKSSDDIEQEIGARRLLLNRLNVIDDNLLNCSACKLFVTGNDASDHIKTSDHKQQLCLENLSRQLELIAEYPKVFEEWQLSDLYYNSNRIFLDPVVDKYVYCGICCVELHLNLKEVEEHVSSRKHDALFLAALVDGKTSVDGIIGIAGAVKPVATPKMAKKIVEKAKIKNVAVEKNVVAVSSAADDNDMDSLVKFLSGMSCSVPAADKATVAVDTPVDTPAEKPTLVISGALEMTRYVNDNWGCRLSDGTIACLVCNARGLQGNPVMSHFDSTDHKEIVERMQKTTTEKFMPKILHENCISATYGVHPVVYQCLICKGAEGSFSTKDIMVHVVSEGHKASKEKWRRVPNTCPLLFAKIQAHKLSTVKLWCVTCKKELFNIAHAFHHIEQAPHHPNTSVDFITSIGNCNFNCTVCLLTMHGENDLLLHYRSTEHQDNRREANTIKSATKKSAGKDYRQKNEQHHNNVTAKVPLLPLPYPPVNVFPPHRFPGPLPQVPYLNQQPNFIPYPHPNQFHMSNQPINNYNYAAGTAGAPENNHNARNDFNRSGNNRHNSDNAHRYMGGVNNCNRRPRPNKNDKQKHNLDQFTQRVNMSERQIDKGDFKGKENGRIQKGNDGGKPSPVEATKAVAQATKPVAQATKPVAQATKPVTQATKPVTQATKPVVQATKPVAQASKPISQDKKPTSEVKIPTVDSNKVARKAAADKKAHKAVMAAKAAAINKKRMKAIEQKKRDSLNGNLKLRSP